MLASLGIVGIDESLRRLRANDSTLRHVQVSHPLSDADGVALGEALEKNTALRSMRIEEAPSDAASVANIMDTEARN